MRRVQHFAFHLPPNFDVDNQNEIQAIIVLIPKKDDTVDYTAEINVARDGEQHTELYDGLSDEQEVFAGQLAEIDVSALIPYLMPLMKEVTVPVTCNQGEERIGTMVDNAICLGIETVP